MNWFKTTVLSKNFWLGKASYDKTPSTLSVTVVVPAWNEEGFIRDTIESLLAQTYPCTVIVVDDASTDNTPNIVREYPSVQLLTTDKNQGSKSKALNYAIPYVSTDIFICVDADTIIDPNGVGNLIKAFNDPNTMIASGFVFSKDKGNFWQSARFGEYQIGQTIIKSAQQNANAVLVASGCFFAIRLPFLKQNPFPTRTLAEDMDLTWTAIESGYRVTFVEDAYCSVSDPNSRYLYDKQVSRWYRGFFQNIRERNFNLFKRNIKLGIVVYGYMLVNLLGTPMAILAMFFASTISYAAWTSVAVWFTISVLLAAYTTYQRAGRSALNPRHYINFVLISFYTYYIFIRSAIQELVLNNKLDTWVKGH